MQTGDVVGLVRVNFSGNRADVGPAVWSQGISSDSMEETFFDSNTLYCPSEKFSYHIGDNEDEVTKL